MKFYFVLVLFLGFVASVTSGTSAASDDQTDTGMMKKKAAMQNAVIEPQQTPLQRVMCEKDGVAAGGMDLVSYRQSEGPVPGNSNYSIELMGDTYFFVDEANLDIFRADPQRYLPAYAGFCAMSLALGSVTCPDVMNYKIEDDRLLFFETTGFTNGQTLWESDPLGFRVKADLNYKRLDSH